MLTKLCGILCLISLFFFYFLKARLIYCNIIPTKYQKLRQFHFLTTFLFSFHTVHGVLKARILKWFAIPFYNGPHSVRPLHHDPSLYQAVVHPCD